MPKGKKSKHNPMVTYFSVAIACILIVLLVWAGTTCDNPLGGTFGQTFSDAESRGHAAKFTYVANMETKEYWPNETRYVNKIPKGKRVYFDAEFLQTAKGYKPGPR